MMGRNQFPPMPLGERMIPKAGGKLRRRAHDAVAEVRLPTSKKYERFVEGDIEACFDEISHSALMERARARVGTSAS